jgi:hypothetical protein
VHAWVREPRGPALLLADEAVAVRIQRREGSIDVLHRTTDRTLWAESRRRTRAGGLAHRRTVSVDSQSLMCARSSPDSSRCCQPAALSWPQNCVPLG